MSQKFGYDIHNSKKSECSNSTVQTLNSLVGTKFDDKTADTAFGKIKKNKLDIDVIESIVRPANAQEGTPNLKGTQLSHASAISAHASNLLEIEDIVGSNDSSVGKLVPKVKSLNNLVGTKVDTSTADTAFGRIKRNKDDIEDIEEITNSTTIENVYTSYWWVFDVSPGVHYIKKDTAPSWKPFDVSNPHIMHPNEIYITAVRMSMKQDMAWVLSIELFESKFHTNSAGKFVLIDQSDKGASVVKFSTNDIKQSKFKSIVSTASPFGYKLQDPADYNGFYVDHIKKTGENSGAIGSPERKLYIDIVYKSYNKFGDHWWTSKSTQV